MRSRRGVEPRVVLWIGVLVDAESHCPLTCQHVRLLCGDARVKIGRPGGFAWFRKGSDETFPDRFRDGTPREPSTSLLDHVAQLGPGRRPARRDRLQDLPKLNVHGGLLDTLADNQTHGTRTAGRKAICLSLIDTHAWTARIIDPQAGSFTARRRAQPEHRTERAGRVLSPRTSLSGGSATRSIADARSTVKRRGVVRYSLCE